MSDSFVDVSESILAMNPQRSGMGWFERPLRDRRVARRIARHNGWKFHRTQRGYVFTYSVQFTPACDECDGSGEVVEASSWGDCHSYIETCPKCSGSGVSARGEVRDE